MITHHGDAIAARPSLAEPAALPATPEQREIRRLEFENDQMREALKNIAYGAVMMIAVTDGATRKYVREVYRVAMQAVGGSSG